MPPGTAPNVGFFWAKCCKEIVPKLRPKKNQILSPRQKEKSRKKKEEKEASKGYPRDGSKILFCTKCYKEIVTKLRPKKNQILSSRQKEKGKEKEKEKEKRKKTHKPLFCQP